MAKRAASCRAPASTPLQSLRAQLDDGPGLYRASIRATAKEIGISATTLRFVEQGRTRPDRVSAERIAAYYSRTLGMHLTADMVAAWCNGYGRGGRERTKVAHSHNGPEKEMES